MASVTVAPKVQTQDPKSKIQNPIEARPFAVVLGVVLALLLVGQQVPASLDQDFGSSAPLLNVSGLGSPERGEHGSAGRRP